MVKRIAWNKGRRWTESTKRKISASRKGGTSWNKGKSWSNEMKEKMGKARKGTVAWNKGRSWPEATRKKMGEARKGTPAWNKGRKWEKAVKKKVSKSRTGIPAWNKGRSWSAEVKRKIARTKILRSAGISTRINVSRRVTSRAKNKRIFERDNFVCQICKRIFDPAYLQVDHKVPRSKGGSDNDSNLQTLCANCHTNKSRRENRY